MHGVTLRLRTLGNLRSIGRNFRGVVLFYGRRR